MMFLYVYIVKITDVFLKLTFEEKSMSKLFVCFFYKIDIH